MRLGLKSLYEHVTKCFCGGIGDTHKIEVLGSENDVRVRVSAEACSEKLLRECGIVACAPRFQRGDRGSIPLTRSLRSAA